jgi:hypothetical protein
MYVMQLLRNSLFNTGQVANYFKSRLFREAGGDFNIELVSGLVTLILVPPVYLLVHRSKAQ